MQIDLYHAVASRQWERAFAPQFAEVDERLIELLAEGIKHQGRRPKTCPETRAPVYLPARWLVPGEIGPGRAGILGGPASWIECVDDMTWRLWRRQGDGAQAELEAGAAEVARLWVDLERTHHAASRREAALEVAALEMCGLVTKLRAVEAMPSWAVLEGMMCGAVMRLRWCSDGWTWGAPVEVAYWDGHQRHGVSEGLALNGRVGEAAPGRLIERMMDLKK